MCCGRRVCKGGACGGPRGDPEDGKGEKRESSRRHMQGRMMDAVAVMGDVCVCSIPAVSTILECGRQGSGGGRLCSCRGAIDYTAVHLYSRTSELTPLSSSPPPPFLHSPLPHPYALYTPHFHPPPAPHQPLTVPSRSPHLNRILVRVKLHQQFQFIRRQYSPRADRTILRS